jgi:hypothetical protein
MTPKEKQEQTPIGPDYGNERAFKAHIRNRARALGWLCYDHPDSRYGHGSGFPDLAMSHRERGQVAFIECKTNTGRFSPDQDEWIGSLMEAAKRGLGVLIVDIWRPKDFQRINRYLETGQ